LAKKNKTAKPPRQMTRRALSHHKRQVRRQRIIFFSGVGIIAAVVLIVLLGWFLGMYRPMHATVVKVGDRKFNIGYVVDYVTDLGGGQASSILTQTLSYYVEDIINTELARRGAEELGFKPSGGDIRDQREQMGLPDNKASADIARMSLLYNRLKDEYFAPQTPASQAQVDIRAMLVESEPVGQEVRRRLAQGEDFAALITDFAADAQSLEENQGDYGWHPRVILGEDIGSAVPVDYAFGAMAGDISQPLYDENKSKRLGYWLININEKFTTDEFQVYALYLGSQEEAEAIRQRLEDGEDMDALAEEYSQYSQSQQNGGDLGLITRPEADAVVVSQAFDDYVFGEERETGVWSQPIRDGDQWTTGGYWVVQVVGREDDRELSDEDYQNLLDRAYSDWLTNLQTESAEIIDRTGFTTEAQQLIVEKVTGG